MMNNTTTSGSNIERAVMRRIHLIRILGLVISTGVLAILTLVLALWGIGREVWVARVFQNAPTDFMHIPNFFIAAFGHTRLVVQVLALLTFASFVYLARKTVQLIISTFASPRA
ncbi:MAG: hypothetical protein AAB689_01125 [Patescibacteria group bacterium]